MNIRQFASDDAEFCFKVRSKAFIEKFYGELTPEDVAAGVNAYMPNDYIRMAEKMPFFIIEFNSLPIGFFTIRRKTIRTPEIPLIYIDLKHLGKGTGKTCIQYIEKWVASNWTEVKSLIVDTVIPKYNGGFYKRLGFVSTEQTFCDFPDIKVQALRFCKELKNCDCFQAANCSMQLTLRQAQGS